MFSVQLAIPKRFCGDAGPVVASESRQATHPLIDVPPNVSPSQQTVHQLSDASASGLSTPTTSTSSSRRFLSLAAPIEFRSPMVLSSETDLALTLNGPLPNSVDGHGSLKVSIKSGDVVWTGLLQATGSGASGSTGVDVEIEADQPAVDQTSCSQEAQSPNGEAVVLKGVDLSSTPPPQLSFRVSCVFPSA